MKKQDIQAEINFFDKIISDDDSFSQGEYSMIYDKIIKFFNGNILEAGCSSGSFGVQTKKHKPSINIVGVDVNQKFIDLATKRGAYDKLICDSLDERSLFEKEVFDTVFCPFVVHHFPDIKNVMSNFEFWLKPKGFLVIVDPNGSNLILRLSYFFRSILLRFFKKVENYASINESHKSVYDFKKSLKNFDIVLIETFNRDENLKINSPEFSLLGLMVFLRVILLKFYRAIPFLRYSGSDLIIVAQKK